MKGNAVELRLTRTVMDFGWAFNICNERNCSSSLVLTDNQLIQKYWCTEDLLILGAGHSIKLPQSFCQLPDNMW